MKVKIDPANSLNGVIKIPGDKSISHRSIIMASLAEGKSLIEGFLESEDCLNTVKSFQALGINICKKQSKYEVQGKGLYGLNEAENILNCGNSGTTMRLLCGLLSAQKFYSVLTGDCSLRQRPMGRVINPIKKMNGQLWARNNNYAPISIKGSHLNGIKYELPVASAQVKSAILLAGLYADKEVEVIEPGFSRDHTERMLASFGVEINKDNLVSILPNKNENRLQPQIINIPGDISSAAYFIAAGLIIDNSEIIIKNVGINPTRSGILTVLKKMGADFELLNIEQKSGEPVSDIKIKNSSLKGVEISGEIIPKLIDEIPIIAVLATQAEGITTIRNAEELRVKESDRIKTTTNFLKKMGADIKALKDGFVIKGPVKLKGGFKFNCFNDHRIAMSMITAGLVADESIYLRNSEVIKTSFPKFNDILNKVISV